MPEFQARHPRQAAGGFAADRSQYAFPVGHSCLGAAIIFALRTRTGLSVQERFAWSIAAILFGGSVINYLDRAVLGVVMPQIRRDLGLTNQQYGWAVNAFLMAYMFSYIVGGRLADRFGCRKMVALTLGFWSVAGMTHALVRGLGSLSLVRALLGFGEAGFYQIGRAHV